VPQDEALAAVRRFASGYQGEERAKILTQVFAGVFETLSAERSQIVRGIKKFYRRQESLAERMEEGWKLLGEIDPNTTDPKLAEQRAAIQQQIDWDSRVFDDRQRPAPSGVRAAAGDRAAGVRAVPRPAGTTRRHTVESPSQGGCRPCADRAD
jgi:hypothetical protein